jgi:hypothetical protein
LHYRKVAVIDFREVAGDPGSWGEGFGVATGFLFAHALSNDKEPKIVPSVVLMSALSADERAAMRLARGDDEGRWVV